MSASAAGKITVLIADDHPVVRQGLRVLLSLHPDIEVVGEAGDGAEAVELAAAVAPDVILLDLKLPGLDGLGVLAELRDRNLPARVLVLTSVAFLKLALQQNLPLLTLFVDHTLPGVRHASRALVLLRHSEQANARLESAS